jgi:hypothetical protein
MKEVFFSIILLLLPWVLKAQFNPFEKRKFFEIQFKGNVKEVEIIEVVFEIKNGKLTIIRERIAHKACFDNAGYLNKWVLYSQEGSVYHTVKTTTVTRDRSQLVDSTFDSDGKFYGKETITFNKATKEFSKKYYVKNGTLGNMYVAKFDSKNREIEVRNGLPNKSSYEVSKNSYGSDGHSMTQKNYDVYGKLEGITHSTYLLDGKLAKTKYTATGENVSFLVDYEYNKFGYKISQYRRKSDGSFKLTWDYSYSYDSVGNVIEEKASKNGTLAIFRKFRIVYY